MVAQAPQDMSAQLSEEAQKVMGILKVWNGQLLNSCSAENTFGTCDMDFRSCILLVIDVYVSCVCM